MDGETDPLRILLSVRRVARTLYVINLRNISPQMLNQWILPHYFSSCNKVYCLTKYHPHVRQTFSVVLFSAGSNDYVNNFLQPFLADSQQYTHDEFVGLLISTLEQQLVVINPSTLPSLTIFILFYFIEYTYYLIIE